MSSLDREFLERIEEVSVDQLSAMYGNLTKALLGEDKLAYGDLPLRTPAEFVLYYLDLQARHVLDHLVFVDKNLAERLRKRFDRDSQRVAVEVS